MQQTRTRRGFTLAEMLVTISLIAVLAAVVVPSISGSLFKGDAGRVSSDLLSIRGGIEQFLADVRKYPGRHTDLSAALSATVLDINAGTSALYGTTVAARWKGPYLNSAVGATGFGGTITPAFQKVDCATHVLYVASTTTTPCLAVVVLGLTQAEAVKVDGQIDDGVATTGIVQYRTGVAPDSLWYIAMPIQ